MKQTPEHSETTKRTISFSDLQRSAGVLLHITSLPSSYGIGDIGIGAKEFAGFLQRSGQTFWQLLPLNPTTVSNGNSPYSAISGMAGNPLLISPDALIDEGLLTQKEVAPYKVEESDKTDFEEAEKSKCAILEIAYRNFCRQASSSQNEFAEYCKKEAYWLDDFTLFCVLLQVNKNKPWYEWEEPFKHHEAEVLLLFGNEHSNEINKIKWQQYIFAKQWQNLKSYCNQLNIQLFGDMPIYVGYNSSDVWSNQDIFSLDKDGKQLFVAGTPPDDFNKNGQLWGMPVFKWDVLKSRNYDWWVCRLKKNLQLYNFLCLDHFRAFSAYWQIKASLKSALKGERIEGPGKDFFAYIQKELGQMPFIAEDLGDISEDVYQLRDEFQLPGMEVLSFAFGEKMSTNVHIPHNHIPLCVVYTGTHDTNTTLGWFASLPKQSRKNLFDYTGIKITSKNVCDLLCRIAYASVSKLAVLPMQDILELGEEARMNMPSSGENNWAWRMTSKQMKTGIEEKLKGWCELYNRQPQSLSQSK